MYCEALYFTMNRRRCPWNPELCDVYCWNPDGKSFIRRGGGFVGAPIVHFEIMGGQGKQLEEFYSQLFGWNVDSNNPMNYGMVQTGGEDGINGGVGANEDGSSRVTVYAQVDDLQETLDRVEQLGGKTILPPSDVPGGPRLAMFADPAGNVTGIVEPWQDQEQ